MIKQTFEFDSFGPWILEIKDRHKLPPLFASYNELTATARLLFKIPRGIERRRANPDMHLYDMVVGIFPGRLLILQRDNNSVIERWIELNDIKYITVTETLLSGRVIFYTTDDEITIKYNTVSHEIITRFLTILRSLQYRDKLKLPLPEINFRTADIDILYYNLLREMKTQEPDNRFIAYQPNFIIPLKNSFWKKIYSRISTIKCYASTVFLINSSELIIIDRSTQVRKGKDSTYSYTFTYIPIANIASISLDTIPAAQEIYRLTIKLSTYSMEFYLNTEEQGITQMSQAINNLDIYSDTSTFVADSCISND